MYYFLNDIILRNKSKIYFSKLNFIKRSDQIEMIKR